RVLGVDSTDRQEWLQVRVKIEPYRIGRYGQLMEWSRDIDNPKDNHRHTNHLFGLFPGHDISVKATPELAEAARVVLDHRGDFSTGWSMGWKLNLWAHLRDGNRSYALLQNLLRTGTLYNLWDTHPPYQIDGNLGGLSGMNEMLLQSEGRTITLLPACPQAWDKGSVKGLRARGNVTVDIDWTLSANSLAATLSSPTGGTFDIVFGDRQQTIQLPQGKKVSVKF
uniref:glycosyl hydrolase family 95 catalytic domain-containing protein n=1 Tax=Prevotella sp. TaxID=59823 RepID=UPI004026272E